MFKIVLALITAGIVSQLVKLFIFLIQGKKLKLKDILATGSMPSSHAAFVTSLAMIILLNEGLSTSFAISLVLMFIVLRDAFGVRKSVGEEGKVLEKVIKKLKIGSKINYSLGHTPLQVFIGSVIGVAVAVLVHYIF